MSERPDMASTDLSDRTGMVIEHVKAVARAAGFDACGIASVDAEGDDGFDAWLDAGMHAGMTWMAAIRHVRQRVTLFLEGARSVVVLAANYHAPSPSLPGGLRGKVARYARFRDYHRALRRAVLRVAEAIREGMPEAQVRISIDSAPVRERAWAARAGVGWIGKNSLVIVPGLGSWCFLATVVTTAALRPDAPIPDRCGSCRACLDACPTGAIVAPRVVDARLCVAYHTIENRDAIPPEIAVKMGNLVFGCDICQEVCPWNRRAPMTRRPDFQPRSVDTVWPPLDPLMAGDARWFDEVFTGTPVRRAKLEGMRRNAWIAMENARAADSRLPPDTAETD
ncbi:MAG TPA: tRNA epoxyqueuosine(34) reductase QueG [Candidatus Hydrogenedentes bacterium]|nr:tRNA epoxyqueuosine(34) reductase QueG [Candidatus Hydrogenedentota bacterium]HOJ67478.1 tRNA epoxyqueuosine(34) reductase QueG [Candidatus Hydrogenedentota bacterium]HOK88627.1 tRNA epoxyqueuosine(34) reductase QueG [Candidatus Hydrogenedentota bacterium]